MKDKWLVRQFFLKKKVPKDVHYRPDIDGLRAIAVIAVVIYHAFPTVAPGGFFGVDIFFVISGFLITGIIHKNLKNGSFRFADFWARRIRRIFPALLTVTMATFIAGWFYLLPIEFAVLKSHIQWALGFVANFKLNSEVGYFDTAAELKPLLHLWSLAIEEQFYLVWPGLLWFCFRKKYNLFTLTSILALTSFLWRKIFPHSNSAAFYLPWTRFWELQVGALVAIYREDYSEYFTPLIGSLERKVRPLIYREGEAENTYGLINTLISMIGFGLILYACVKFDRNAAFPSKLTVLPVLGAALIIISGKNAWANRVVLSSPPMVFVGLISFPLYLWHWPLLSFTRIIAVTPTTEMIWKAVTLSLIFSIGTYFSIEKFMRFERGNLRWRAPALGLIFGSLFLFTQYSGINAHSALMNFAKINDAITDDVGYPTTSMIRQKSSEGVEFYEIDTNVPKYTLFIGDSHMYHYGKRIEKLSSENPNEVLSSYWFTEPCCLLVDGFERSSCGQENKCGELKNTILKILKEKDKYKIGRLVWSQSWTFYLERLWHNQRNAEGVTLVGDQKLTERKKQVANFLKEITESGVDVTVILSGPIGFEFNPKTMIIRDFKGNFKLGAESVDRNELYHRSSIATLLFGDLQRKYNFKLINPLDSFCVETSCPVRSKDGRPISIDGDHITGTTALNHTNYIDETVLLKNL